MIEAARITCNWCDLPALLFYRGPGHTYPSCGVPGHHAEIVALMEAGIIRTIDGDVVERELARSEIYGTTERLLADPFSDGRK